MISAPVNVREIHWKLLPHDQCDLQQTTTIDTCHTWHSNDGKSFTPKSYRSYRHLHLSVILMLPWINHFVRSIRIVI